ncbi:hypothetical protein RclHR1_00940009 [Rhizophagus clarus]|uniref:Uncharacterized protein n=1 Tax=Rhizophagus clarus TaxID=94130 RepID=A0A2Z6S459_9GLOM|nr:hypothetical protein RclHR1_00940009 [Rhizophagus clarus]
MKIVLDQKTINSKSLQSDQPISKLTRRLKNADWKGSDDDKDASVVKAETLKISLAKNKEGVIEVIQTGSRDNGSMALYQLVVVLSRP